MMDTTPPPPRSSPSSILVTPHPSINAKILQVPSSSSDTTIMTSQAGSANHMRTTPPSKIPQPIGTGVHGAGNQPQHEFMITNSNSKMIHSIKSPADLIMLTHSNHNKHNNNHLQKFTNGGIMTSESHQHNNCARPTVVTVDGSMATSLLPPPPGHGRLITKSANEANAPSNENNNNSVRNNDVIVCTGGGGKGPPPPPPPEEMPDDGDCSDTDMEVKSLDLTGRLQPVGGPGSGGDGSTMGSQERARPMSWEGGLSEDEGDNNNGGDTQEDSMRDLEEPMSPMSPDAPTTIQLPTDNQVFVTTENTNTILTSDSQTINLTNTKSITSTTSQPPSTTSAINLTTVPPPPPALLPISTAPNSTCQPAVPPASTITQQHPPNLLQHLQQQLAVSGAGNTASATAGNLGNPAAALVLLQQQQQEQQQQSEPLPLVHHHQQHATLAATFQLQQQLQTQHSILQQQIQQSQQLQQQLQQSSLQSQLQSQLQTQLQQLPHSNLDSPVPARGSDSGCEVMPGPYTPTQSPSLPRFHSPNPLYSPTESPGTSRHVSGFGSPYSHSPSTGLSRNNSDASQYGGSITSYSSAPSPISPTPHYSPPSERHISSGFSPLNGPRNNPSSSSSSHPLYLSSAHPLDRRDGTSSSSGGDIKEEGGTNEFGGVNVGGMGAHSGITRQQLINSPCPICSDKISGFHYGIFSCESCKGFFKRTVQNKKNYVCMRGASCPVTISTRKKCPACRFEKCLGMGMRLEAIREDRTRGGRSTYQISAPYTLPPSLIGGSTTTTTAPPSANNRDGTNNHHPSNHPDYSNSSSSSSVNGAASGGAGMGHHGGGVMGNNNNGVLGGARHGSTNGPGVGSLHSRLGGDRVKSEPLDEQGADGLRPQTAVVPQLLQQIHDVEHLWRSNESEMASLRQSEQAAREAMESDSPDFLSSLLCKIADDRLYKIVKWCKNLPLFRHISIDDQISLLINSWCELLLLSCCFRSIESPGEIKVSSGKTMTQQQANAMGIGPCIERMLNLTNQLRRLQVDKYEYMAMKVIVLLSSDVAGLKEKDRVQQSQERVLHSLEEYTRTNYPHQPAKYGEILMRIPELQRTSHCSKELLTMKKKEGDMPSFNFLFELLKGDH